GKDSLQKFADVMRTAESSGACTEPFHERDVAILPLFGWYDYSFGEPNAAIKSLWTDYRACRWPAGYEEATVAKHFASLNDGRAGADATTIITFSHFLPRIDVMPTTIPLSKRFIYPVLGTSLLEEQLRSIGSTLHVYGHSHVHRRVTIDGVTYINNAF